MVMICSKSNSLCWVDIGLGLGWYECQRQLNFGRKVQNAISVSV